MPDPLPRARRVVAPPPDDGDDHRDDDGDDLRPPRRWLVPAVVALTIFGIGTTALLGYMAVKLKRESARQRNQAEQARAEVGAAAPAEPAGPKPTGEPRRATDAEWADIDGVIVAAVASRMDDDRLMVMVMVSTDDEHPPVQFFGWHHATGNQSLLLTLPGGAKRYPLADPLWDEVQMRLRLVPGSMFGSGRIGGGSVRTEQLLFDTLPKEVSVVDLDLPGRPAGAPRTFRFRLSVKQPKEPAAPPAPPPKATKLPRDWMWELPKQP